MKIDNFVKFVLNTKVLIVLISILIVTFISHLLPTRYEMNDDVMMLLFSSGSYTGHPENVLVFINYIYGSVLQVFYSVLPNYEWYTLFFLFFHVISVSVLSYEILRNQTNKITKIVLMLILYLFEVRLLFQLQFTTTAALLALSGLILLNKKSYVNYFLGALFFITASLIRFEAAFLVLLVIFPLFLKNYIRGNKNLKIKIVFTLTLVVGLAYGLKFVDYSYVKQHQEWRNYYEYNKVRGKINDNPNFARTNFDIESVEKDDIYFNVV